MGAISKLAVLTLFMAAVAGSLASSAYAQTRYWRRERVIVGRAVIVRDHRTPSGLMLGVRCFPSFDGLRVLGTIPGFCADGRLARGDVLLRVRVPQGPIYPVRTFDEIEDAKSQIGPGEWAVLQLFRPSMGTICMWVRFAPLGASAACPDVAEMRTEEEHPGASAAFDANAPDESEHGHFEMESEELPGSEEVAMGILDASVPEGDEFDSPEPATPPTWDDGDEFESPEPAVPPKWDDVDEFASPNPEVPPKWVWDRDGDRE